MTRYIPTCIEGHGGFIEAWGGDIFDWRTQDRWGDGGSGG